MKKFFSYFGTKRALVKKDCYPAPSFDTIIEPFAGAAAYSCKYFYKNVILVDLDPRIYKLWKYLIGATEKDILSLPLLSEGQTLDDFKLLTREEQDLIGYNLARGSSRPNRVAGGRSDWDKETRALISNGVNFIKHWEVYNGSYESIKDIEGTWFFDPPYETRGGHRYRMNNKMMDYKKLRRWVDSRRGEVIVCENPECTWIKVMPLCKIRGNMFNSVEGMYHSINTNQSLAKKRDVLPVICSTR
jgi:site-specific DNA-adenine methylase